MAAISTFIPDWQELAFYKYLNFKQIDKYLAKAKVMIALAAYR
jgi:hypothetical protein